MRLPPSFPRGLLPPLIIVLMSAGLLVAFVPASRALPLLNHVQDLSLFLFRAEQNVKTVMGLAVAAHVLESFICVKMCVQAGVDAWDTLGWFVLGLLLGGGAIHKLGQQIKKASGSKKLAR